MNTQIIAIANQKGGVGKTTTCANLGIGLAQAGKKVLLIDGDPQGSLTISLGNPRPDKLPFTLSDAMGRILMDEPLRPGEGILHHPEGVDLMPADIQLSGMEVSLVNAMSRETILRQYLDTLKGQYSHILIDCQPSLGICQCQREAEEQRKTAEERQRRMERIKRRKAQGLQDRYLYDYTFANDNGQNPLMDKARAYVENWKEAYKSNIGLLLFGDVGTGKSFFAGCIANALLDQDVLVLMTNFPTILNRLTGMFSEDRADFIASFDEYDLLIIDDLGVERSTEYAMEQMFFVIDSRYRSRRPMIITTNLKLGELKNPPDLAHARIYDRILERCAPILFDGKNFREENAGATREAAKELVSRN